MKKNKKPLHSRLIFKVCMSAIFLFFWLVCSLVFNNRTSFSVLEYGNDNAVIQGKISGKLYKNDKVEGEFIARENDLGVVLIRFNDFVVPDYRGEDVLSFKLREKGDKTWYYFNNYRSGSLKRQLLYPFGFPTISDSKGKVYEFELRSLYGNSTNAVELSRNKPIIKTMYQFPRKEIAGSKLRFLKFLPFKIMNSFTNIDFMLSSVIYLLPFFLYLFLLVYFMKNSILNTKFSVSISIAAILFDILFLRELYIGVFIVFFFFFLISIIGNKLSDKTSFIFSFLLLLSWIVLVSIGNNNYSQKLNIWIYALFVFGVIQLIFETRKNKQKK